MDKGYCHVGYALIILAIISFGIISIAVFSTKQLDSIDQSCADLSTYNPFNGGISIHNATSGSTQYFTSGTLCSYDFDYHYHYLAAYAIPGILLVIAAIMFYIQHKKEKEEPEII